jgi:tetratricopeptide (TPR) repeat protein
MKRGDYHAARLLHERLLEKEPDNALVLYHLGYAHGQTGNHQIEVDYYEKAIALGFVKDAIFFNLGMAYGELNQIEKSLEAFEKAVSLDLSETTYRRTCRS